MESFIEEADSNCVFSYYKPFEFLTNNAYAIEAVKSFSVLEMRTASDCRVRGREGGPITVMSVEGWVGL